MLAWPGSTSPDEAWPNEYLGQGLARSACGETRYKIIKGPLVIGNVPVPEAYIEHDLYSALKMGKTTFTVGMLDGIRKSGRRAIAPACHCRCSCREIRRPGSEPPAWPACSPRRRPALSKPFTGLTRR